MTVMTVMVMRRGGLVFWEDGEYKWPTSWLAVSGRVCVWETNSSSGNNINIRKRFFLARALCVLFVVGARAFSDHPDDALEAEFQTRAKDLLLGEGPAAAVLLATPTTTFAGPALSSRARSPIRFNTGN
jgi:hypothetical protein